MAESFYTDTDLIGSGEFLDGSTLSLSTRMTFAVAGTITAVRWHFPAAAPSGAVGARVYADAGGASLASGSFAAPTLDAWNTVPVSVAVSAGQTLRPAIVTPGRYVAKASFYTSSVTRGNITGINGYFTTGDGFPSGASGNQSAYYVDVVFEPSAGGTTYAGSASGGSTSGGSATARALLAAAGSAASTTTGSAAVTATLAATASGSASSAGSAAAELVSGPVTLTATATAAAVSGGTATARLTITITVAGTAVSGGVATARMLLAAAATATAISAGRAAAAIAGESIKASSGATVTGRTSTTVLTARYQSNPEVTRG